MSHFTHIKTRFQNLFYLEKALSRLNLDYKKTMASSSVNPTLIIAQSNGYNLQFSWNKCEYELITDLSFWQQAYPVETFMDQIAQQYAGEVIIGESHKIGFQPIKYQQNSDGSNTLVLERWDN